MTKTIIIEGMSCGHCSAAVEKALMAVDGVESVKVNLDLKNAVVNGSASDESMAKAIDDIGFEVVTIQ